MYLVLQFEGQMLCMLHLRNRPALVYLQLQQTRIESKGSEPDIAAFLAAARLSTSSIKINTRLLSSLPFLESFGKVLQPQLVETAEFKHDKPSYSKFTAAAA